MDKQLAYLYIDCEFIAEENGEEITVGTAQTFAVPRVGESIWFSNERHGYMSWTVVSVAHWVGSGEGHFPYQRIAVYVIPTGSATTFKKCDECGIGKAEFTHEIQFKDRMQIMNKKQQLCVNCIMHYDIGGKKKGSD